jgi:hypothetical protein
MQQLMAVVTESTHLEGDKSEYEFMFNLQALSEEVNFLNNYIFESQSSLTKMRQTG